MLTQADEYSKLHDYCIVCKRWRPWYRFKIPFKKGKQDVCLQCKDKEFKLKTYCKLNNLVKMATRNKMEGLRDHLFETIEGLRDGSITTEKAKAICEVSQVIINSAKVELDFIKIIGAKKSAFLQIEDKETADEHQ